MKWLKERWVALKAWFNYSWSIAIARLEMISGVIVGALVAFPWDNIATGISGGWNWTQGALIGGTLFIKGLISEVGRRSGTVTLSDGQLMPADVSERKEAIAVIKESEKK